MSADDFCINKLVPGYFSRINEDGSYSNGSGCGNDTASERNMVRKYIVDSVCYWADVFEYYKGLIKFRKAHPALRLSTSEDVKKYVKSVYADFPFSFRNCNFCLVSVCIKKKIHLFCTFIFLTALYIKFRKAHPALRLSTSEDVKKYVKSVEGLGDNIVGINIKGGQKDESAKEMYLLFNANTDNEKLQFRKENGKSA